MNARPRVGLIGCGRIGQVHLRTLLAHPETCELVAVVDANEPVLQEIVSAYRPQHASTDDSLIFDDRTIDAVIIASSTESHAQYIEAAAGAGKSAFTEKPIALDLEATDRALTAVERAGTRLQVGFQRRFDTGYSHARKAIESGELGTIEMIRDAMRDPSPPPQEYLAKSGGLFHDMTIHNFDCVRWLKGADPIEVFAVGSALTSNDVRIAGDIDTSIVTIRFGDGSLASIENSRRSGFGYDVRTEIFGSNGAMMIGDSRQTPVRRYDRLGVHEDHQFFFLERFAAAYEAEMLSFLDAMSKDIEVAVTGADGRTALALAEAAVRSRSLGRPVPFNERDTVPALAADQRMTIRA